MDCIEHWSRELALDIPAMKRAVSQRICWLPGAQAWLEALRARGKRLILLTNAHPETLTIKDGRTGVVAAMHAVVSSHALGAPKEDPRFWEAVHSLQPFDPRRSLFVDDSPPVLRAARAAGVQWIYAVRRAGAAGPVEDFPTVGSVADIELPAA